MMLWVLCLESKCQQCITAATLSMVSPMVRNSLGIVCGRWFRFPFADASLTYLRWEESERRVPRSIDLAHM